MSGAVGGPLVLIVEDNAVVALDLEFELTDAGIEVLGPAYTVPEALAFLVNGRPDFALLDFNLAGESVTKVALRLRELGVPFVLTSAYSQPQQLDAVFNGVVNWGKPLNIPLLIRRIRTMLAG